MPAHEFDPELINAAARMRDAVNLHVVAGALGVRERHLCWIAVSLDDGRSNGDLYDSRQDAVNHTKNLSRGWFFILIGADSMGERESIIVLQQARQAFKNGVVFAEEQIITPHLSELMKPFLPNTLRKLDHN